MELVTLLLIVIVGWLVLKLFAGFFHVAIFALALPFKLLAIGIASLLVVFVAIPLGLVAALTGLIVAPFAIILPLAPFLLIGLGVYLLVRNA